MALLEKNLYWRVAASDTDENMVLLKGQRTENTIKARPEKDFEFDLPVIKPGMDINTIYVPFGIIRELLKTNRSFIVKTTGAQFILRPGTIDTGSIDRIKAENGLDGSKEVYVKISVKNGGNTSGNYGSITRDIPQGSKPAAPISELDVEVLTSAISDEELQKDIQRILYDTETGIVQQKIDQLINMNVTAGGNGNYTYSWSDPQNQNTATATGLCPDTLSVVVTDQLGCTIQDQVIVIYVDSFPTVDATADTTILYQGQSTSLHGIIPAGGIQFQWTPTPSLNDDNIQHPLATPSTTTTYTVIATDANGCTAEDTITIQVIEVLCAEPEIFIPSAFSPNNDLQNDVLFVRGNTIEKVYLAIYDRWGEKVFETNSTYLGWDGTYQGKLLAPDVYVYYVEATCYNQAEFRKKGNISLIR